MQIDRNQNVDFLKFLGLSLIILAHLSPPAWLFQLRNFDVPLMVLISGVTYSISAQKLNYWEYFIKRVKRLALPAWIFLTVYFACLYFFKLPYDKLTPRMLFHSYTFISGIGFVWIFRVFLITALLAPFILKLNNKLSCNKKYLLLLLFSFIAYEVMLLYNWEHILGKSVFFYFNAIVLFGVFYALIFSLGVRFTSFGETEYAYILLVSVIVLIGFGTYSYVTTGVFPYTQKFKYPPRLYYLSYSLILCIICYHFSSGMYRFLSKWKRLEAAVLFISQNTLWIYFYHIVFIKALDLNLIDSLLIKYLIVYGGSVICYYLQFTLLSNVVLPAIGNSKVKKELKAALSG